MYKKLTPNQKKWKAYIAAKLKAARPRDKSPEFLAMMIAATIKLYNDVGLDLTTLSETMEEIENDPGFKMMVREPRQVLQYLQSPESVLKASRNVNHLFVHDSKKDAEEVEYVPAEEPRRNFFQTPAPTVIQTVTPSVTPTVVPAVVQTVTPEATPGETPGEDPEASEETPETPRGSKKKTPKDPETEETPGEDNEKSEEEEETKKKKKKKKAKEQEKEEAEDEKERKKLEEQLKATDTGEAALIMGGMNPWDL